jgi:amino acid transporter
LTARDADSSAGGKPTAAPSPTDSGSSSWLAEYGTVVRIDDLPLDAPVEVKNIEHETSRKLGEWKSTAICGNDITSSCLYVAALCAVFAGPYAPIALLCVAATLYLYRKIYAEVGTALPLNGGAYNVLLNTTTKAKASVAACLTLLSYIATAVISATEAMHYAHNLYGGLNVFWATIALLAVFAVLNVLGITESANVALAIFVVHIATLATLVVTSSSSLLADPSLLVANWHSPPPGGIFVALFFGFSAALLGISGFESSANFIEEQKEGVFPKTLRNMWIAVAIFNPLISFLAMGLMPIAEVGENTEALLAEMGHLSAGTWLQRWISVDATLVLSGAVLTSYVGVTGLVRRMSLDRCLPQFLLSMNRWRGTNHWIILLFFLLCCSVLAITLGRIELLAGVYTLSFLGVMALFAIGNMLLKVKRDRLPRQIRASWLAVVVGLVAVCAGLVGNILLNPDYVKIFLIYFVAAIGVVGIMFMRVQILNVALAISQAFVARVRSESRRINNWIMSNIEKMNSQEVVYFSKGDNIAGLNRAALYVLENEITKRLMVVHCFDREEDIYYDLVEQLRILDRIYPQLKIDLLLVKGRFSPQLIEQLSRRLNVPKNYMFIGTPGDRFPHNIAELGGVRVIM